MIFTTQKKSNKLKTRICEQKVKQIRYIIPNNLEKMYKKIIKYQKLTDKKTCFVEKTEEMHNNCVFPLYIF